MKAARDAGFGGVTDPVAGSPLRQNELSAPAPERITGDIAAPVNAGAQGNLHTEQDLSQPSEAATDPMEEAPHDSGLASIRERLKNIGK